MNSYHVLELVGEGSFGRVHKGRKKLNGQIVALKFMPKVGRSEKELQGLKREIEIMRNLQHPHIVQLFDSFETETEVVVVTEYAEGQLFQILEDDGSFPESRVREIACQLVSALYYLHSHRILHRDMKPQNILLGKNGVVKLCDFGFARAMSVSTLVLTSIKGTPLYMSPELVEEKPYDHTADLWSLGCILYELHTGAPPFYTNSIFHLVQLIVRNPVKWPDTMSDTCMSFLKGLLTKDPQKRLSWPDLLHHPFVADNVVVLSDSSVHSPLTVTPSPDMLALKRQQVSAKTLPSSGESRLLQKVRGQRDNGRKPSGNDTMKKVKDGVVKENGSFKAAAYPRAQPSSREETDTPGHFINHTANNRIHTKSKHRGQISRDYEKEFPSVEVGPQVVVRCNKERRAPVCTQDVDSEDYWEKLFQESGQSRHKLLNHKDFIPRLTSKILEFKAELRSGTVKEPQQIHQTLKVLRNVILASDHEKSHYLCREIGLPHLLLDLVHDTVANPNFIKQPWSVSALGEMIIVLLIFWEKHCDWAQEEHRIQEYSKPFIAILSQPKFSPLAPLAASVLSLFLQHEFDVEADVDTLISLLKTLLETNECLFSLPPNWGLCDGFLCLLLHTLPEHERGPRSSHLDPVTFLGLWKRIGSSLERTPPDTKFCSTIGLYSFLSLALFVFTKDPYSCIPLFSDSESKCVYTLSQLLSTECLLLFAEGSPGRPEEDLNHDNLSMLSCHLLCFPFALDLPAHTMSRILELYDSCGIVAGLLQVIQMLTPSSLELPLSLLSRLLLCDPGRSVSCLRKAAGGFLLPPRDSQLTASRHPGTRTASSLLSDLLQLDVLWDSAVELLTLLSHVARYAPQSTCHQLYLEASVLHQALTHSHDPIRAATCRLLGNLHPFRPIILPTLKPATFKHLINCLRDASVPVRRMACRAVGSWLGYIAEAGFKMSRSNGKGSDITGWSKEKSKNKQKCLPGDLATIVEQGVDDEDDEDGSRWMEEARKTVAVLASLIFDPDALTRCRCCAALGNLVNVNGAVSLLLEENVSRLLLKAACVDSHNAVRQAAITTLRLYTLQEPIRQVLISLGARKKLCQASHRAPPQCDYQKLIGQL
ncbi:serine/threonine-protein kinase 36 [Sphaeramia orbicularis]|nr:serine/threonine-protein kinase 36 [Sphaeramia orbicularis]